MKNIELYIPQIYFLITLNSNYSSNIVSMNHFNCLDFKLKNLFDIYGSDKGNMYSNLYINMLEKYKNVENIRLLEIGLGTNNPTLISTMGGGGTCGGSLRAFRDYLPNALIFGADVDKECLFNEQNIKTFFVDQLEINTFDDLYKNCGNTKFDIIIDDGLHSIGANLNTLTFALNHVNKNGVIIIEDIPTTKIQGYQIVDFILTNNANVQYKTSFVKYNGGAGFIYMIEVL